MPPRRSTSSRTPKAEPGTKATPVVVDTVGDRLYHDVLMLTLLPQIGDVDEEETEELAEIELSSDEEVRPC